MRRRVIKLYVLDRDSPEKPPAPHKTTLYADGTTIDACRASAYAKVTAAGFELRSISFSPDESIVVYAYPAVPKKPMARQIRESELEKSPGMKRS